MSRPPSQSLPESSSSPPPSWTPEPPGISVPPSSPATQITRWVRRASSSSSLSSSSDAGPLAVPDRQSLPSPIDGCLWCTADARFLAGAAGTPPTAPARRVGTTRRRAPARSRSPSLDPAPGPRPAPLALRDSDSPKRAPERGEAPHPPSRRARSSALTAAECGERRQGSARGMNGDGAGRVVRGGTVAAVPPNALPGGGAAPTAVGEAANSRLELKEAGATSTASSGQRGGTHVNGSRGERSRASSTNDDGPRGTTVTVGAARARRAAAASRSLAKASHRAVPAHPPAATARTEAPRDSVLPSVHGSKPRGILLLASRTALKPHRAAAAVCQMSIGARATDRPPGGGGSARVE